MPRISIELSDDKLLTLIPILLKEGIKFMVSPDKLISIVDHGVYKPPVSSASKQFNLFASGDVVASGESSPRTVKHVHHIKGRKLPDIVLEYFDANTTLSSFDVADKIMPLGFKPGSASSTLNDLYKSGKLIRIREGKVFYYSLNKEYDPLSLAKAS